MILCVMLHSNVIHKMAREKKKKAFIKQQLIQFSDESQAQCELVRNTL